jgi:protease I
VDVQLSQVQARDYDAVIFIGGSGAAQYVDDPVAHKLAYDAVKERKVVGAICMAPLILAKAGLLKGKKATVYPALADDFKQYGMKYTAKPVEKDGRIITADGPNSAAEFGQELAKFF